MLHYKGDIMKKNPGKKADIVILKDAKAEAMKKLLTMLSPGQFMTFF